MCIFVQIILFPLIEDFSVERGDELVYSVVCEEEVEVIAKGPLVHEGGILFEEFLMTDYLGYARNIHVLNFVFELPLGVGAENAELGLVGSTVVNGVSQLYRLRPDRILLRHSTQNHFQINEVIVALQYIIHSLFLVCIIFY